MENRSTLLHKAGTTPVDSSCQPQKKTVIFSPQEGQTSQDTNAPSHASQRLLTRKPTPFHNDLAASIMKCGLDALIAEDCDAHDMLTNDETNKENVLPKQKKNPDNMDYKK